MCNIIYVYLYKNNVCGCCFCFDYSNIVKLKMINYWCFLGKKYFVYKKFDYFDNFRDDLEFLLCVFEKKIYLLVMLICWIKGEMYFIIKFEFKEK